jgi:hypothetical protein
LSSCFWTRRNPSAKGDGVAAEDEDTATIAVHFGDERVVDVVEMAGEFFGAALRAEGVEQGVGEGAD